MRSSFMAEVSEGLIPRLEEFVAVFLCDFHDIVGLVAAETFGECEFERVKPEFGRAVASLDVDMRRLEPVRHVKEKAESAFA